MLRQLRSCALLRLLCQRSLGMLLTDCEEEPPCAKHHPYDDREEFEGDEIHSFAATSNQTHTGRNPKQIEKY